MRFLFLIVLMMFAIQTQAIEADRTRLKEYELVTVTHEVGEVIQATFNFVNEDGTIERRILGDEHFDRRETATTFTGPPGMYEITVGKPLFIEIVREGRPQPNPTPKPNPDPKPQPDPKPEPTPDPEPQPDLEKLKVSTILFVEEQQDRSINQAETLVLTNQDFRDRMKAKGVNTVILDKDLETGRAWKGLTDIPLPIVVFYEDSKRYKIQKVPKTLTELNALVGKVMQ